MALGIQQILSIYRPFAQGHLVRAFSQSNTNQFSTQLSSRELKQQCSLLQTVRIKHFSSRSVILPSFHLWYSVPPSWAGVVRS